MTSAKAVSEKSEPAVRKDHPRTPAQTRLAWPLMFNDSQSLALRLADVAGPTPPFVPQAKPKLSTSGDQFEQEADRIAEQVPLMRTSGIRERGGALICNANC